MRDGGPREGVGFDLCGEAFVRRRKEPTVGEYLPLPRLRVRRPMLDIDEISHGGRSLKGAGPTDLIKDKSQDQGCDAENMRLSDRGCT